MHTVQQNKIFDFYLFFFSFFYSIFFCCDVSFTLLQLLFSFVFFFFFFRSVCRFCSISKCCCLIAVACLFYVYRYCGYLNGFFRCSLHVRIITALTMMNNGFNFSFILTIVCIKSILFVLPFKQNICLIEPLAYEYEV